MPENRLTYDVKLNIAQARAEVNQLLRIFRSDLQTVTIPALAPQIFTDAVTHTRALSAEFQKLSAESQQFAQNMQQAQAAAQRQAQSAARPAATAGGGGLLGGLTGTVAGGLAGYLTIQGVRTLAQSAQGFADLGVQVRRSEESFSILSNGAKIAEQNVKAIKEAAGGTVDSMTAMGIGTQLVSLKLAKTTEDFKNLTRAGRQIALVSPTIHDVGEALTQLSLFASNAASYARADQLGLETASVKERIKELQAANDSLTDSQAKLIASTQLLEEEYGKVLDSSSAAASGVDKFKVAITEARQELAKGPLGQAVDQAFGDIARSVQQATVFAGSTDSQALIDSLQKGIQSVNTQGTAASALPGFLTGGFVDELKDTRAELEDTIKALRQADEAVAAGVPGAEAFRQQVGEIAQEMVRWGFATDDQAQRIDTLSQAIATATALGNNSAQTFSETANALVIQGENLSIAFGELDRLLATTGEFTPGQLPGIDQIRQALIALKSEIATTGTVTDEQNAAISQMESILSGANSAVQFMSTAEGQAAIATGQFNAELATTPGYLDAFRLSALQAVDAIGAAINIQTQLENSISSSLSGLISRGLISSQQARVILAEQKKTASDYAAGIANSDLSPQDRVFAQAQAQYNLSAPIRQIEENDRLAKEAIREQEAAQKKAASAAESAFKKAASEAERAFKKAAAQLEGDIRSTPGLFGGTQVTQEQLDLAAGGIPQNFADNFVRRLKDEVENGKDWEGVSIDMAREALGRVGIVASDNAETVVRQIAEAWSNSTLFSDPANLALIDQEAVQANLDLREKARIGQENILKHFGVVIDEAVEDAISAAGGGSISVGTAPPIAPVAAPIIGPLPAPFGQYGPAPDTGGTLDAPYVVPVTVTDTAMTDITTQLFDQATAEQERLQALGGVIGGMMEIGFLRHDLAPMTGEFISSIAANLGAQGDIIQGQGTNYATIVGLGITRFDYTEAAGGIVGGIAGRLAAQGETIQGQGADYASIVGLGIAGYDFTTATKSAMIGIRSGFGSSENLDMAIGTGSAIMQFIIDGMGGKVNEEGSLDGIAAALFAKLLESINEGV